jgi:hypothetical protein
MPARSAHLRSPNSEIAGAVAGRMRIEIKCGGARRAHNSAVTQKSARKPPPMNAEQTPTCLDRVERACPHELPTNAVRRFRPVRQSTREGRRGELDTRAAHPGDDRTNVRSGHDLESAASKRAGDARVTPGHRARGDTDRALRRHRVRPATGWPTGSPRELGPPRPAGHGRAVRLDRAPAQRPARARRPNPRCLSTST